MAYLNMLLKKKGKEAFIDFDLNVRKRVLFTENINL